MVHNTNSHLTVCEVLKKGVSGIIVPGSSENVKLISDTASLYNVPVIAPTATSMLSVSGFISLYSSHG